MTPTWARRAVVCGISAAIGAVTYGQAPTLVEGVRQDVRVTNVRNSVYLLTGAGGNIVAQAGPDGVLLVDSGVESMADKVLDALRALSSNPVQYIVNTTPTLEHAGGNILIRQAGATFTGGNATNVAGVGVGASVVAHENLLARVSSGDMPLLPQPGWPTDTFFVEKADLFFNEEPVEILHQPDALTDAGVIVHFRRSDVIAAGDIFRMDHYPVIDLDAGGSINGVIDALNRIIAMTVPEILQEGGTLVLPGHGRIGDESEVVFNRDMLTIIRNNVADLISDGKTLDQIKAARPALAYDSRWGASQGPGSTDAFIETVYRSLASHDAQSTAAR